jgi:hypothetical protein
MAEIDFSKLYKKYKLQFVTKDLSDIGYVNIIAMSKQEAINAFLKHSRLKDVKVVDCKFIGIVLFDDGSATVQPLTMQVNGETIGTYTGAQETINIPVPTKTSQLTNDSGFVDSSALGDITEEVADMVMADLADKIIMKTDVSTNFTDADVDDDTKIPTIGSVVRYVNQCILTEEQVKEIIDQYSA